MPHRPTAAAPLLHDVTGAGDPIVLVPGGLGGWRSWLPFVAPLAADRQVVRVQLRNVELAEAGRSFPVDYSTLTERDALRATVDRLGLAHFDLVGWSYGGHVALAFALDHPHRVRTLTLIEPAAVWVLRALHYPPELLDPEQARAQSLRCRDVTIADLKTFLVEVGLASPGQDVESHPSWPLWVRNRQVLAVNGAIWDYTDSLDRLRALTIPLLAVRGDATAAHFAAVVDHLAATAPRVRVLTLPGGHAPHLQHPDQFLTALRGHLTPASPP